MLLQPNRIHCYDKDLVNTDWYLEYNARTQNGWHLQKIHTLKQKTIFLTGVRKTRRFAWWTRISLRWHHVEILSSGKYSRLVYTTQRFDQYICSDLQERYKTILLKTIIAYWSKRRVVTNQFFSEPFPPQTWKGIGFLPSNQCIYKALNTQVLSECAGGEKRPHRRNQKEMAAS